MQQTLLIIDPWWFGGPVLVIWLVIAAAVLVFQYRRHGLGSEVFGLIPMLVVVAILIQLVLPALMVYGTNPQNLDGPLIPLGLAIRGYGVMMLLAMLAGVGLAVVRGQQVGIAPESVVSLAFWMIVSGVIGARLFYVIQYQSQFGAIDGWWPRFRAVLDMTRGGLVVYGGFLAAMLAAGFVVWLRQLRWWTTADVLAPGLAVGLAIGRIGCLLNGCCFGGACDVNWVAVQFPVGSPPYMRHLESGELLGMTTRVRDFETGGREVHAVAPGSLAEQLGIEVGEQIFVQHGGEQVLRDRLVGKMPIRAEITIHSDRAGPYRLPVDQLPARSVPIHPTQLYSAINALLIGSVLWFFFPFRRRAGDVFGLLLLLYSVSRFVLEYVRVDEGPIDAMGWFTVSQWVSLAMFVTGMAIGGTWRWRPVAWDEAERAGSGDRQEATSSPGLGPPGLGPPQSGRPESGTEGTQRPPEEENG